MQDGLVVIPDVPGGLSASHDLLLRRMKEALEVIQGAHGKAPEGRRAVTQDNLSGFGFVNAAEVDEAIAEAASSIDFGYVNYAGDNTGTNDNSSDLQAAIDSLGTYGGQIRIPPGIYLFTAGVTIPEGKHIIIIGNGLFNTEFKTATSSINFFSHTRTSVSPSIIEIRDLSFRVTGSASSVTGIYCVGSASYPDSQVRLLNCRFWYLDAALELGYCGGLVENCASFYCNYLAYMTRGASFVDFDNCLTLVNTYGVYATDTTAEGYSNTVNFYRCKFVFSTEVDLWFRGFDAVHIIGCGCDIGGSGDGTDQAAIFLYDCTNFKIDNTWVACNTTDDGEGDSPNDNRRGIYIYSASINGSITNCNVVDCAEGIYLYGTSGDYTRAVRILGCDFRRNIKNHIISAGGACGIISTNMFDDSPPRSGSAYEVFLYTTGATGWIVRDNIFEGASYTILTAGNDSIGDNIWSESIG